MAQEPVELEKLGSFYDQLSLLDSAGLTYEQIFTALTKNEKNSEKISQYRYIIQSLQKGRPLSLALQRTELVPEFDLPLIEASEKMGRLPEFLKRLAANYKETVAAVKEIKAQMIQPILTLVMAVLVPDFPKYFAGLITAKQYMHKILPPLAVMIVLLFIIQWVWLQSIYKKNFRRAFFSVLSYVPGFSGFVKLITLEKFCMTFELALDAGVDIYDSIQMAAQAAGTSRYEEAARRMVPMIREGVGLERVMQDESVFPGEFITAIQLGLNSGELPEFINKYRKRLLDEMESKRRWFVKLIPRFFYALVAIYVGSIILGFYKDHFNELNKVLSED